MSILALNIPLTVVACMHGTQISILPSMDYIYTRVKLTILLSFIAAWYIFMVFKFSCSPKNISIEIAIDKS